MSKQLNGGQENNTQAESTLNSTRLTQATEFRNLCHDQHEISTIPLMCADLAICTRSGHTSHEDFIIAIQIVISLHSAEFSHRQWTALPSRRFLQTSCQSPDLDTLSWCLELIFLWTSPRSILVCLFLLTAVIQNGILVHLSTPSGSQSPSPQPAPPLAHVPHVSDQCMAMFCCLCNRGESRRHHP